MDHRHLAFLTYDFNHLWLDAFVQSSFGGSSFTPYSVIQFAILAYSPNRHTYSVNIDMLFAYTRTANIFRVLATGTSHVGPLTVFSSKVWHIASLALNIALCQASKEDIKSIAHYTVIISFSCYCGLVHYIDVASL